MHSYSITATSVDIIHWNVNTSGTKALRISVKAVFDVARLIADVKWTYDTCYLCKICKSIPNNYGHLLSKNIDEDIPWRTIYIDLIGLY